MKYIFYILFFISLSLPGFSQSQAGHASQAQTVVKLYPNPATTFVNFEFEKKIDPSYKIILFNFIGKKMEEIQVTDQKVTVPLTNFYRGIYIYQLRDGQGNIIASGKFQVVN